MRKKFAARGFATALAFGAFCVPAAAYEDLQTHLLPNAKLATGESHWILTMRGTVGHSNNVPNQTAFFNPGQDALYAGLNLGGTYVAYHRNGIRAGISAAGNFSYFYDFETEASFQDKDFFSNTVTIQAFAAKEFMLLGKPSELIGTYTYRRDDGPTNNVTLTGHSGQADMRMALTQSLELRTQLDFTKNSADRFYPISPFVGGFPGNSYSISTGINKTYANQSRLSASYSLSVSNGSGLSFTPTSHRFTFRGEAPVTRKVWVAAEASINQRNYQKTPVFFFSPISNNPETDYELKGQLIWQVSERGQLDLYILHSSHDDSLEDERYIGVGYSQVLGEGGPKPVTAVSNPFAHPDYWTPVPRWDTTFPR